MAEAPDGPAFADALLERMRATLERSIADGERFSKELDRLNVEAQKPGRKRGYEGPEWGDAVTTALDGLIRFAEEASDALKGFINELGHEAPPPPPPSPPRSRRSAPPPEASVKVHVTLTDAARAVLERARAEGTAIVLPPEQLARSVYEEVDKVLKAAGGRWKKGKGHVFKKDAGPILAAILERGGAVNEKKVRAAFYTPPELAARLAALVAEHLGAGSHRVLEPSIGGGALAEALWALIPEAMIIGVEVDHEAAQDLLVRFDGRPVEIVAEDFLAYAAINMPQMSARFDAVIMNPPFTRGIDAQHVLSAAYLIRPGGILAAIVSERTGRIAAALEEARRQPEKLLAGLGMTMEPIEEGAFATEGTNVKTAILRYVAPILPEKTTTTTIGAVLVAGEPDRGVDERGRRKPPKTLGRWPGPGAAVESSYTQEQLHEALLLAFPGEPAHAIDAMKATWMGGLPPPARVKEASPKKAPREAPAQLALFGDI